MFEIIKIIHPKLCLIDKIIVDLSRRDKQKSYAINWQLQKLAAFYLQKIIK